MEILAAVGLTVVFLGSVAVLTAIYAVWEGWVLSVLWGWFAVPLFHLPSMKIGSCIGIALIFGLMTHQYVPPPKEQESSAKWMGILHPFIAGGASLLIGYYAK